MSEERARSTDECNATASVKITHHFLEKLLAKKLTGCFVYTASAAGYIPNPFAVMYGATKAFLMQFAASLAVEVKGKGIDVLSVQPSPVASRFYDKAHKLDALKMAISAAVPPEALGSIAGASYPHGHT